jgi:hypothetical protein
MKHVSIQRKRLRTHPSRPIPGLHQQVATWLIGMDIARLLPRFTLNLGNTAGSAPGGKESTGA